MSYGPGWINDIFDCKLEFEESCFTTIPDEHELVYTGTEKEIKCFDGKGAISGKLIIVPPEGREVSHNGVEIIFKSESDLFAGASSGGPFEVVLKKWVLLEAGTIGEPIEVGFDIDLAELKLRDSFVGNNMSFVHSIGYRIVRPWYTFSVRGDERVVIRNTIATDDAPAPPSESIIKVDDFGGVCTFDHGKCVFNADGRIIGNVNFTEMVSGTSVCEVAMLLGRTEMWTSTNGEDVTVRYHVLHTKEQAPITCEEAIPVDISLAAKGSEDDGKDGPLPPTMLPLKPVDPELSAEHVASVTYWVRLLLTKSPTAPGGKPSQHWSTHPILLLPSTDSGISGI